MCRSCRVLEQCQAAAWPLPAAAVPQVPDWDHLAVQLHTGTCGSVLGNITQMPGKQQNVVAAVLATCDKLHLLLII